MDEKWNPKSLLKLSGVYWQTCTLHTAVKLDIFTVISDQLLSAKAISEKCQTNGRATRMLLNALCAMELLKKNGDLYENISMGRMFLSKTSPKYIGYMIMHHHQLADSWTHLSEAIEKGSAIRDPSSHSDAATRKNFLMGMYNSAMQMAEKLVGVVDLSDRTHLLDLGGGPGTYAAHFCKRYENLNATVFDLPETRPFAEKVIEEFNMTDRIHFLAGDFVTDTITGEYDAAYLSHVLHGESAKVCQEMIQKVAACLKPSGVIVIHEFILNDEGDGPLFPALFSMNMLLGTEKGQSYTECELRGMLEKVGAKKIERLVYEGPSESGILMARL